MKPILTALAVVLAVNTFFYLGQMAVFNLNPNAAIFEEWNYQNSWLWQDNAGNSTHMTLRQNITANLPDSKTAVSTGDGTGNFFTDMWRTFTDWFKNTAGVRHLDNLVNAVPNFIKMLGLPKEAAYALGWFWHVFVFFIVLMFIKGDT